MPYRKADICKDVAFRLDVVVNLQDSHYLLTVWAMRVAVAISCDAGGRSKELED